MAGIYRTESANETADIINEYRVDDELFLVHENKIIKAKVVRIRITAEKNGYWIGLDLEDKDENEIIEATPMLVSRTIDGLFTNLLFEYRKGEKENGN